MREDEPAQSEVLGFVFVFAIIMIAIGLVSATGFTGLHQLQRSDQMSNAVNSFEILADNIDDLVDGAPGRKTEIALAGAGLYFGDTVTVNVSGHRTANPAENFSYEFQIQPIVYDPDTRSKLVYVNGAVIRDDPGGMLILREPRFRITDREVVFPIIHTRNPDGQAVGGQSDVVIQTRRMEAIPIAMTSKQYNVALKITSPRATGWERYLSAKDDVTCSRSGDTVTCSLTTNSTYISLIRVGVYLA